MIWLSVLLMSTCARLTGSPSLRLVRSRAIARCHSLFVRYFGAQMGMAVGAVLLYILFGRKV